MTTDNAEQERLNTAALAQALRYGRHLGQIADEVRGKPEKIEPKQLAETNTKENPHG